MACENPQRTTRTGNGQMRASISAGRASRDRERTQCTADHQAAREKEMAAFSQCVTVSEWAECTCGQSFQSAPWTVLHPQSTVPSAGRGPAQRSPPSPPPPRPRPFLYLKGQTLKTPRAWCMPSRPTDYPRPSHPSLLVGSISSIVAITNHVRELS